MTKYNNNDLHCFLKKVKVFFKDLPIGSIIPWLSRIASPSGRYLKTKNHNQDIYVHSKKHSLSFLQMDQI